MKLPDWTANPNGSSNSSALFLELVASVAEHVRNARVGDSPETVAGVIVADLAHGPHKVCPKQAIEHLIDARERLDSLESIDAKLSEITRRVMGVPK